METILHRTHNDQRLVVIKDMFDSEELQYIKNYCNHELRDGEQGKNNLIFWQKELVQGIPGKCSVSNLHKRMDEEIWDLIFNRVQEAFTIDLPKSKTYIMYYNWEPGGGINWHTDPTCSAAISIYLNENYHDDFGGMFTFKLDNDEFFTGIPPLDNTAVFQSGFVYHAVQPINLEAPSRKSIQVFVDK